MTGADPRRGVPTRVVLASKSPARLATLVAAGITPWVVVSHVDEPAVLAALPGGRAFSGGTTTPAEEVLALATAKCRAVADGLVGGSLALPLPPSAAPDAEARLQQPPRHASSARRGTPRDDSTASAPATATPPDGVERLVVVGCDSMLELDGRMLGKPHRPDVARARIREMRNRSAVLWTGHFAQVLERRSPASPATAPPAGPPPVIDEGVAPSRQTSAPSWSSIGEVGASAHTTVHFGDMTDAEIDAYVDSGEPLKVAGSFTVDGLGGPFVTGIEGDFHSVVGLSLPLLRSMLIEVGVFWPDLWDHRGVIPGS